MTLTEKEDMVRAIALAVAPLAADRDQISLQLDLAKADRDKWFNTARAELALRQTAEAYAARNALRVIALEGFLLRMLPLHIEQSCDDCGGDLACCHAEHPDCPIAEGRRLLPQTETACTCDSTLVTATSNHQPHCPRYVAETGVAKSE